MTTINLLNILSSSATTGGTWSSSNPSLIINGSTLEYNEATLQPNATYQLNYCFGTNCVTYDIFVADCNPCNSFNVTEGSRICNGSTMIIPLIISGGTLPYTITSSNTSINFNIINNTITVLNANSNQTINITVSDSNGCSRLMTLTGLSCTTPITTNPNDCQCTTSVGSNINFQQQPNCTYTLSYDLSVFSNCYEDTLYLSEGNPNNYTPALSETTGYSPSTIYYWKIKSLNNNCPDLIGQITTLPCPNNPTDPISCTDIDFAVSPQSSLLSGSPFTPFSPVTCTDCPQESNVGPKVSKLIDAITSITSFEYKYYLIPNSTPICNGYCDDETSIHLGSNITTEGIGLNMSSSIDTVYQNFAAILSNIFNIPVAISQTFTFADADIVIGISDINSSSALAVTFSYPNDPDIIIIAKGKNFSYNDCANEDNTTDFKVVMMHEIFHSFGLSDHDNTSYQLMSGGIATCNNPFHYIYDITNIKERYDCCFLTYYSNP